MTDELWRILTVRLSQILILFRYNSFRISEIFEDSVEIEEKYRAIQSFKLFPVSSCGLFYEISFPIFANRLIVQSEIVEILRGAKSK